jgi:hypothetical protein
VGEWRPSLVNVNGYSRIHEERSSNLLVIRYFDRPLQYFNRGGLWTVLVGFKAKNRRKGGNQPIRVKEYYINFKSINLEPVNYKISSTKSGEALWNELAVPQLPVFEAVHLSSIVHIFRLNKKQMQFL